VGEKRGGGRDWREYNERLVARGEAYVSLGFLESWRADVGALNRRKVGRPYRYPEGLMMFLGYLHALLHVDFRGLQGFLRGLRRLAGGGSGFDVPYYSQICRRVNVLDLKVADTLIPYEGKDVVVSLDSTGVKVTNRGEWMRRKWKTQRGWIKVHISVDDSGKQVVALSVTDEGTGDTREFSGLVEQSLDNVKRAGGGKIAQVKGDGAYDSNRNFEKLEELGITPCIRVRSGAKPGTRSKNPRKKYAREFYELGYSRWRTKYGYGRRWYAEVPHSVVKRKCGEYVQAKKKSNMAHEVKLKYLFYNALIKYDACGALPWNQNHPPTQPS
jgi:hypothetical protein